MPFLTVVQYSWRTAAQAALALVMIWGAGTPTASAQLGRALGDPLEAPADAAPAASDWAFDLSATTSFPLSVGIDATLTTPVGIFGYASVGHTPNAYLSAIADVAQDAGMRATLRPLIDEVVANGAWNVRLGIGYTIPEGLELSVGYTMLTTSAALSPRAIELATRQRLAWPGMTEVPISMTVHALHARVGWRFVIEDHFVARVALGWTHGVALDASLTVPEEIRMRPDDPATRIEEDVESGFGDYGFAPELMVSAGYRF